MRSKLMSVIALAAFALGAPGDATAATVGVTSVAGTWSSTDPTNPPGLNGLGTNAINWGKAYATSKTGRQSGYSFVAAAAGNIETDKDFVLGTFTHNNFVIDAGTSIKRADLSIGINLMIGGFSKVVSAVFNFDHWETDNFGTKKGRCADGGTVGAGVNVAGCADRVSIRNNTNLNKSFAIDGFLYILEITGFTIAGNLFSQFWTTEDMANSAILTARFKQVGIAPPTGGEPGTGPDPVPSPVPLPAAGWLMLAGLGALAAARARCRKA